MMTRNREKWKIDQSRGEWRSGRGVAHGKRADNHHDPGGLRECFDNGRWRHGVAVCEYDHGNVASSNAGRGRSSCTRRRSCDNRWLDSGAHAIEPAHWKRSPTACVSGGTRQRQPSMSTFKRSLSGDLNQVAETGPRRCHGRGLLASPARSRYITYTAIAMQRPKDGRCGPERAVEMPGPWKEWKSKNSFPTLSTAPWESRKQREIPTFPQPSFATAVLTSIKNRRRSR
jgi:hypothetical protein